MYRRMGQEMPRLPQLVRCLYAPGLKGPGLKAAVVQFVPGNIYDYRGDDILHGKYLLAFSCGTAIAGGAVGPDDE